MYNELIYCSNLVKSRDLELSDSLFKKWLEFNPQEHSNYLDYVADYLQHHNFNFCHLKSFAKEVLLKDIKLINNDLSLPVKIKYSDLDIVKSFRIKVLYELDNKQIMTESELENYLKNMNKDLWER